MNVTTSMFYFACYVIIGFCILKIISTISKNNERPAFLALMYMLAWPLVIAGIIILIIIAICFKIVKLICSR